MHEYHKIKNAVVEILSLYSFSEDKADTETDYYGSIHCIYASGDKRFMISWDGGEGFGSVEYWEGNNSWSSIDPIVPEASEEVFNKVLSALCESVKHKL